MPEELRHLRRVRGDAAAVFVTVAATLISATISPALAALTARPLFAALAMPKKIENVVFSIAMEDEARPFVQSLGLAPQVGFFPKAAPFVAYRGKYKGCTVTVVTSGKDSVYGEKDGTGVDNVGTVPAALAAVSSGT